MRYWFCLFSFFLSSLNFQRDGYILTIFPPEFPILVILQIILLQRPNVIVLPPNQTLISDLSNIPHHSQIQMGNIFYPLLLLSMHYQCFQIYCPNKKTFMWIGRIDGVGQTSRSSFTKEGPHGIFFIRTFFIAENIYSLITVKTVIT